MIPANGAGKVVGRPEPRGWQVRPGFLQRSFKSVCGNKHQVGAWSIISSVSWTIISSAGTHSISPPVYRCRDCGGEVGLSGHRTVQIPNCAYCKEKLRADRAAKCAAGKWSLTDWYKTKTATGGTAV